MTTSCGLIFVAMQASELAYFGVVLPGLGDRSERRPAGGSHRSDVRRLHDLLRPVPAVGRGGHPRKAGAAGLADLARGGRGGADGRWQAALGVLSVDSFVPLPYVTGLVWVGIVSILLAVRPSRAATGTASEGVRGARTR